MRSEDTELKWDDCAVCGKSVEDSEGFTHLNIKGEMIALFCETFEKETAKYLGRRAVRKLSENTHPSGSFSLFDP